MSRNSSSEDGHGAAAPENFSPNAFNPQQLSGPDLAHIAENTAQGLALIQGTLQAMLASLERANNDQEALSNTLDTGLRETLQAMLASLERANNDQEASSNTIDTGLREIAGGLDRVESELTGNSAQMNLLLARTEAQASDIGEQFRDVCAPFQEMFREEMERQQAARDALAASEVERRQRTWMIIISRFLASSWAATKREIVAVWNNVPSFFSCLIILGLALTFFFLCYNAFQAYAAWVTGRAGYSIFDLRSILIREPRWKALLNSPRLQ